MDIAGNESSDWVTVVFPVFGIYAGVQWRQLRRPNEHVAVEDDRSDRNQTQHSVEMEHILKFMPLPSEETTKTL